MISEIDLSQFFNCSPYALSQKEKLSLLLPIMRELSGRHYERCGPYKRALEALKISVGEIETLGQVPFLPVSLFKEFELSSIPREEIYKVMSSSGTSGQGVSKIFLDRKTSALQSKILSKLMKELIGSSRLPMLIIDSPATLQDRKAFSARGAGILGFSMFGRDVTYALDVNMNVNYREIEDFCRRNQSQKIFIFGFTFMIWKHFVEPILRGKRCLDLRDAVVLHGGGWKKLADSAVDQDEFRQAIQEIIPGASVVNYYGMVEQTGSLYFECEQGFLHAPIFSEVITRRPSGFDICEVGEPGVIEVMSVAALSYPGHALLTDDIGTVWGLDGCACGRRGKFFSIHDRIPAADVRGCSDTYSID